MGIIKFIARQREKYLREYWYQKDEEENCKDRFAEFCEAEKNLSIVCGEMDPQLYEDKGFIDTITKILDKGIEVKIATHLMMEDFDGAKKEFYKKNPKLNTLNNEKSNLHIYWLSKKPELHFAVVDEKNLFFEDPHPPGEKRRAVFKYDNEEWGKEWKKNFEELLNVSKAKDYAMPKSH